MTRRPPAPVSERAAVAVRTTPAPPPPACMPAPPQRKLAPPTYTVKRGETLYQIALDHGLDYRELAAWNNIENVNVIRVGQVLVLAAPGAAGAASARRRRRDHAALRPRRAIAPVRRGNADPARPPAPAAGAQQHARRSRPSRRR